MSFQRHSLEMQGGPFSSSDPLVPKTPPAPSPQHPAPAPSPQHPDPAQLAKERYELRLNYKLPTPVSQVLDGWMKASEALAIITALLAGVQAGVIAIIKDLPGERESALWRTFRFFVYTGLLFDLGATLASVYITVQGSALPGLARKMIHNDPKSAPYRQVYYPKDEMDPEDLDGKDNIELLKKFGLGTFWEYVAYHMLWSFVLGYIFLFISIILLVCGMEVPVLIIPIVVVAFCTAVPVYGFLRLILPV